MEPLTYYDSAENATITRKRALQELKNHGITHNDDIQTFYAEVGQKDTYDAQEVLIWLGY